MAWDRAETSIPAELHLLEYHKQRREYLRYYTMRMRAEAEAKQATIVPLSALRVFSKPEHGGKNLAGYDGTHITDDLVSDVFSKFTEQTRRKESEESMRTKTGKSCRPRFGLRFQLPFMVTSLDFFSQRLLSRSTLPSAPHLRPPLSTIPMPGQDSSLVDSTQSSMKIT